MSWALMGCAHSSQNQAFLTWCCVSIFPRWSAPGNVSPGVSGWSPDHGQDIPERLTQLSFGVPHLPCLAATLNDGSVGAIIFKRPHPLSPAPFMCSGSKVQGLPPAPPGCWLLCKGTPTPQVIWQPREGASGRAWTALLSAALPSGFPILVTL